MTTYLIINIVLAGLTMLLLILHLIFGFLEERCMNTKSLIKQVNGVIYFIFIVVCILACFSITATSLYLLGV